MKLEHTKARSNVFVFCRQFVQVYNDARQFQKSIASGFEKVFDKDMKKRKEILANIVLAGGSTSFPGFDERGVST